MTDPGSPGSSGTSVLDTSAVIAYMLREPGWEKVQRSLSGGLLSTVNLCEVLSKFSERGEKAETILSDVLELGLELIAFTPAQALSAAMLRPVTRHLGLSLGDRACIALGLERAATVLTADAAWAGLEAPHQITVIR